MTRFPTISPGPWLAWLAAACLLNANAWAAPANPDPLDARAVVPTLVYTSPLARYTPLADDPAQPWREANDRVGRIGGWRAHAREAAQTETPATPDAAAPSGKSPADAARPASGHGHHHGQGHQQGQKQGQAELQPQPPSQGQSQVHKH